LTRAALGSTEPYPDRDDNKLNKSRQRDY